MIGYITLGTDDLSRAAAFYDRLLETLWGTHAEAMALGAKDEYPAGSRRMGFYAAYFRDLDGNKLAVCQMG